MKLKRRRIKRGRIEIIPMIDTIVILLIFYMSFSTFVEVSRDASIELPTSRAGDEFTAKPDQIIVNMESRERIRIGDQLLTAPDLAGALRRIRDQQPQVNSIILRAYRGMTYTDLSAFMVACAAAEIADVTFTTYEAQEGP